MAEPSDRGPRWLREPEADAKRRQNSRSLAQERRIAAREGGKVQAGSGSSRRAPQDVVTPDDMISVKYTDQASYQLKVTDLVSLRRDSLRHGREAAMIIEFQQHGVTVRVTVEEA